MFRIMMVAAAVTLSAQSALANGGGHGSSEAPPPAPKQEGPPAKAIVSKRGPQLVDSKGMTLYYFESDTSGNKSTCNDSCAEKRPPLMAADKAIASGDFTVITRDDGKKMWAYRYRPLYTSQADSAPGDVRGDNPAQLWHVARPY
jgi:predicted lipoprotein with Yx(FWY)xxD motif